MTWELLRMQIPYLDLLNQKLDIGLRNLGKQHFRQFWSKVKFENLSLPEAWQFSHYFISCSLHFLILLMVVFFVCLFICFLALIFLYFYSYKFSKFSKTFGWFVSFSAVNIKPYVTFLCLPNYSEFCIQLLIQFGILFSKHWLGQLYYLCYLWSCWWFMELLRCCQLWKGWFAMCPLNLSGCSLTPKGTTKVPPSSEENVEGKWPKCHCIYHNSK